ncbi:hypothetical protein COCON_G00002080 [Conger conger]|uniref:Uncharacterized protein n=1 Tax=Conger conger TaxID=82655 RepID=A0A9Q1I7D7_CONCO|nr:hypothetical protein COCON_G00002080 [Conger conger]
MRRQLGPPLLVGIQASMPSGPRSVDHAMPNYLSHPYPLSHSTSDPLQGPMTIAVSEILLINMEKPGVAFPFIKDDYSSKPEPKVLYLSEDPDKAEEAIKTDLPGTSRDPVISGTRVLKTLKSWGLELTQAFFLSGRPKGPPLSMIQPHIFFDDKKKHIDEALELGVISALVPYGIGYETYKGACEK